MGSSSTPDKRAIARSRISEDHDDLNVILDRLKATDDLLAMIEHLRALRHELEEHFAREEADDGFTQAIGISAPLHLNRLSKLFREHPQFLTAIDDISGRIQACLDETVAGIRTDVQSLCRALEAHEEAETALLTDAVFTDLGTSG